MLQKMTRFLIKVGRVLLISMIVIITPICLIWYIGSSGICLGDCTRNESIMGEKFYIKTVTLQGTPAVGKVVTMNVQVVNDEPNDQPNVTIEISMPDNGLNLLSGNEKISTSMKKGDHLSFSYQICATQEGEQKIFITAISWLSKVPGIRDIYLAYIYNSVVLHS
jgi:hypothetical protein